MAYKQKHYIISINYILININIVIHQLIQMIVLMLKKRILLLTVISKLIVII